MINTSMWDAQTTYGSGFNAVVPSSTEDALSEVYSAWGPRMEGQLVPTWEGVQRPYVYAGDNQSKFYRTGTTFSNTVSLSTDKTSPIVIQLITITIIQIIIISLLLIS